MTTKRISAAMLATLGLLFFGAAKAGTIVTSCSSSGTNEGGHGSVVKTDASDELFNTHHIGKPVDVGFHTGVLAHRCGKNHD